MEVSDQLQAPAALLPEKTPVPTEWEAGWAPEPLWRKEKYLALTSIRTP